MSSIQIRFIILNSPHLIMVLLIRQVPNHFFFKGEGAKFFKKKSEFISNNELFIHIKIAILIPLNYSQHKGWKIFFFIKSWNEFSLRPRLKKKTILYINLENQEKIYIDTRASRESNLVLSRIRRCSLSIELQPTISSCSQMSI